MNEPQPESGKIQFGISTLMTLTFIFSMIAGFLRPSGSRGFLVVAVTTPIAVLIGWFASRFNDPNKTRLYWSVVTATIFQVVTANVFMLRPWDYFVWPLIAAVIASVIASPEHYQGLIKRICQFDSLVRMLIGTLVGVCCYAIYAILLWLVPDSGPWTWYSAECAAFGICGTFLGLLIEGCNWASNRTNISQLHIAFALVVFAIIFATVAPFLIPGW